MATSIKLVQAGVYVSVPINPHYLEFTRRIPVSEMAKIEQVMDRLDPARLRSFVSCVREPQNAAGMEEVLRLEETPHFALRALREELLTVGEVATICRLHAALGHKEAKLFFALESPGHAQEMVITSGAYSADVRRQGHHYLEIRTERNAGLFFQKLSKNAAPIDLFYVVFPDDQPMPEEIDGVVIQPPTISQRIHQIGTSLFGFSDVLEEGPVRIAASFGMMAIAVAALTPHACLPNPVLGLSTLEDIRKGQEESKRDMAFPFPGVVLPKEADEHAADDIGFTYHDFSHTAIVSHIPDDHRKRFMAISRALKEVGASKERVAFFADLDFPIYRRIKVSDRSKFWTSAFDAIALTHEKAKLAPEKALEVLRLHAGDTLLEKLPQMCGYLERRKALVEKGQGSEEFGLVIQALLDSIH